MVALLPAPRVATAYLRPAGAVAVAYRRDAITTVRASGDLRIRAIAEEIVLALTGQCGTDRSVKLQSIHARAFPAIVRLLLSASAVTTPLTAFLEPAAKEHAAIPQHRHHAPLQGALMPTPASMMAPAPLPDAPAARNAAAAAGMLALMVKRASGATISATTVRTSMIAIMEIQAH